MSLEITSTNPHTAEFVRKADDSTGPLPVRRACNEERELPGSGDIVMTCYGAGRVICNELAHFFCELINPNDATYLNTRFVVDLDGGGSACSNASFTESHINFIETLTHSRKFWTDRCAIHRIDPRNSFLINNNFYLHCASVNGFRGFSGMTFYIVRTTPDLRVIQSNNLWHQGYAPQAFRRANSLINNASFLSPAITATMRTLTMQGRAFITELLTTTREGVPLEELKTHIQAHQRT